MRKLILGAALAALVAPIAVTSASAQSYGYRGNYDSRVQREIRECQRELRRADSRREYQREQQECRREIAQARREAYRDQREWRRDRDDRYDRYDRYGYGYGNNDYRYGYRGW